MPQVNPILEVGDNQDSQMYLETIFKSGKNSDFPKTTHIVAITLSFQHQSTDQLIPCYNESTVPSDHWETCEQISTVQCQQAQNRRVPTWQ